MRIWAPTWFRSPVVYGTLFPSRWKRLLLAVSKEARREYGAQVDASLTRMFRDVDGVYRIPVDVKASPVDRTLA